MELTILARFHAQDGQAEAVGAALEEVTAASRREAGCLAIQAYRATRDPRLFWIFSRWRDEAAFEVHAGLPHTLKFLTRVEPLIDHPLDIQRASPIAALASSQA